MEDQVECRSDSEYAGRPLAFFWQGQRLEVSDVLAQWRTPRGKAFRVRVLGDLVFELFYDESFDTWTVSEES